MTKQTTTGRTVLRAGAGLLMAAAGLLVAGQQAGAAGTAVLVVSATQPAPGIAPGQTGTSTISVADTGTRAQGKTKVTVTLPALVTGQPVVTLVPAAGVTCTAK